MALCPCKRQAWLLISGQPCIASEALDTVSLYWTRFKVSLLVSKSMAETAAREMSVDCALKSRGISLVTFAKLSTRATPTCHVPASMTAKA